MVFEQKEFTQIEGMKTITFVKKQLRFYLLKNVKIQ